MNADTRTDEQSRESGEHGLSLEWVTLRMVLPDGAGVFTENEEEFALDDEEIAEGFSDEGEEEVLNICDDADEENEELDWEMGVGPGASGAAWRRCLPERWSAAFWSVRSNASGGTAGRGRRESGGSRRFRASCEYLPMAERGGVMTEGG